ncbi:MAG: hypothetical protein QNL04_07620 [SAR324 cluster bacterium]|nr:hypothetical protein [SAR324 cluster bacterium]
MKVLLFLFVLSLFPQLVLAWDSQLQVKSREVQRLHSDSDSIGSQVLLNSAGLQLNQAYENWSFGLGQTEESYLMQHPDGTEYISLDTTKTQPKVKYKDASLVVSASVVIYQATNNEALYQEYSAGKKDQLNLHSLSGSYQMGDWGLGLESWQETEVFGLNWHYFTTFVYQTDRVGLSYKRNKDEKLTVKQAKITRVWPEDYDLDKDQSQVIYKFEDPSLLGFNWKALELQAQRVTLSGLDQDEYSLRNALDFQFLGAKHFLNHQLTFVSTITTYSEGEYKYSLIEEYETQSDVVQSLDYSGFTAIKESGFFVSWGYQIKDSLKEQTILDQQIQLALSYAWK